jgi:hypothetical protein
MRLTMQAFLRPEPAYAPPYKLRRHLTSSSHEISSRGSWIIFQIMARITQLQELVHI